MELLHGHIGVFVVVVYDTSSKNPREIDGWITQCLNGQTDGQTIGIKDNYKPQKTNHLGDNKISPTIGKNIYISI